jgi:hypothetical protein
MKRNSNLNISEHLTNKYWDYGNQILYDICKKNFLHNRDKLILTKVLFIGRVYAAAIERRKNKKIENIDNNSFYIKKVLPAFKKSKLDHHLLHLKNIKLNSETITEILEVHFYLMSELSKLTELDKRSFCSKYLHFHLPNLYFLYDNRSVKALRKYKSRVSKDLNQIPKLKNVDKHYANFYCKCFELKIEIEKTHNTKLSPRQLDNILLY